MMMKVSVHRHRRLGSVEFSGIPLENEGAIDRFGHESQSIILDPPGVVRDTVVLAIRARLAAGEGEGEVEGIRWHRELAVTA